MIPSRAHVSACLTRLCAAWLLCAVTTCGNSQEATLMSDAFVQPASETPKIFLFFAQPSSPLETCINGKVYPQSSNRPGAIYGPVGLLRNANGEIIANTAQALVTSDDPWNPIQFYKVRFVTLDPQGWRVSIINNAVGVYASTLSPKVVVLNINDTPAFEVDIATCLQRHARSL